MKSSYLTNFVLLVIVIVLLWLSQRGQPVSQEPVTISHLSASVVSDIQIQRPDKPIVTLQRQHDTWAVTAPFSARANETRINLLLSLLSAPIHGQFEPMDQASLTQFGLSQPESIISFNEHTFSFGGIEPLNKQRYVLHKGMIYLIDDTVAPLLRTSAGSFVDNRLLAEQQAITRLTIRSAPEQQDITLNLQDGHWQSTTSQASSDALNAIIDSWQHAYAMQVRHIDKQALMALPKPQITLWLENNADPVTLVMIEKAQTLQITHPALQLQYDFPLALKKQLIPQADTK